MWHSLPVDTETYSNPLNNHKHEIYILYMIFLTLNWTHPSLKGAICKIKPSTKLVPKANDEAAYHQGNR